MKNSHLFFSLIMIVMFSCVKQDDNSDKIEAYSEERVFDNKTINVAKYQNEISLEGNIISWVNVNNEFVAYTETDSHIHIFIVQDFETNISSETNFKSIKFLDHAFALKNSETLILASVKGKIESENAIEELRNNTGENNQILKINGSGISHIWLSKKHYGDYEFKVNLKYFKSEKSIFTAVEKIGDNEQNVVAARGCDSGGQGSTSCSTTSGGGSSGCSVSCAAGYYACCSNGGIFYASCKCVKIILTHEGS